MREKFRVRVEKPRFEWIKNRGGRCRPPHFKNKPPRQAHNAIHRKEVRYV